MAEFPNNKRYNVNSHLSIQKKRLVFYRSWGIIFDYILAYLIGLFPVMAFSAPFIASIDSFQNINFVFFIGCLVFDVWMAMNLYLLKALVKIDITHAICKDNIESALNYFYENPKVEEISENVFRYEKQSSFLHGWYGKLVTILVNDKALYINITSLGKGETPSAIHGLYNYLKCKQIAKYILSHSG